VDGVVQLRPEKLELEKDSVDDELRREVLCQGMYLLIVTSSGER